MNHQITTETLKFTIHSSTRCSTCHTFGMRLNGYGLCAKCWTSMPVDKRDMLTDTAIRVVTQTTVMWRPSGLLLMVGSAVVGAGSGLASCYLLLRHHGF